MKLTRLLLGLAGLSLSFSIACDEGPLGGKDEPTVSRQDLASEELDARCEYLARCGYYPDKATCKDVNRPDPALVQAIGSSVFGRVDVDGEAAAVWLDTWRELSCIGTQEVAAELEEARDAVFSGKIKAGGECFSDYECTDNHVCDRNACQFGGGGGNVCCVGYCVKYNILAERDACPLPTGDGTRLFAECDPITYCAAPEFVEGAEPPTMGTCTLKADNGLPCTESAGCADGQRCDANGTGSCFKLSPHDGPCNPMLSANPCLEVNDVCDPASSTCKLAPGPGQACPSNRCAGWARCEDNDGDPGTPGNCIAYARRGEACDMNQCLGDLACRDGFCQDITTELVCLEGDPPPPEMG